MIFALAAVAALSLSGCATNAEPEATAETPTPVVTETATPDPVASPEPTEEPEPVEEPENPEYATCSDMPVPTPVDSVDAEQIDGIAPQYLVDSGPRSGAQGETVTDADGNPVAYHAVDGDTMPGIAGRFCATMYGGGDGTRWLGVLNIIRRSAGISGGGDVYAGDTINLSPWTIASVGDENGQVHNFDPATDFSYPIRIPAQH